jgi:hypothetical protein
VLTTTFQTAEEQLNQFVQDPRASIDKRVAMADIRGRFGYMKRALPNFIEVGRRMSEALSAGRVEEAARIAAGFAPYRSLFGEDLTAVRDELAALTASAAGEAHRLNLGCCRSAKSFLPAGSSKLATMRGWRYRRATADKFASLREAAPQVETTFSAAARRRKERPACSPARGSGLADHRLAARCRI